MATAVQKIASLGDRRDIPFNKLVLSQANVRKVKAGVSIGELAEDIGRRGLLENLNVRPVVDGAGVETGMFEVPAGGRRFRALEVLVKAKRLVKTHPIPCNVRDAGSAIPAEEDSLAENSQREALHPLDQFRAFQALVERGQGEEEIAARFFVSVAIVRQRLRLASVAPALLDVYAEDGMTLDQLMAFTITADHARQVQVWEQLEKSYNREPYYIRRMLTEGAVAATDRRAIFVGAEAYAEAGGVIGRDLFTDDRGGWFEDVPLLERLATERLTREAEAIGAEGWKWVEAAIDFPYGHTGGLRRIAGERPVLSDEEQSTYDALVEELDRTYAEYEDGEDLPEEVDLRLEEVETAITAFQSRPTLYDAADVTRAGAFVSIDSSGSLKVERGYVRPEDEAPVDGSEATGEPGGDGGDPGAPQRAVITVGGQPAEPDEDDETVKPLPDRLVTELTAYRTLALRDAVAANPAVALTALLHRLVIDTFQHRTTSGCVEARVTQVHFPVQPDDLKESASAKSVDERHDRLAADLPNDDQALWDHLAALDNADRLALLAHCVSFGVNALFERVSPYGAVSPASIERRIAEADRLANAVGLDLVQTGWRPTAANYLGRVTKARILEAVREGKGEMAAQLIDHLKKVEMAKEAERLLADTGWLPEPLRTASAEPEPADGEVEALPDFLADDKGTADDEQSDTPFAVAAE
ncbi:ParB/RepB/Spo0J family partition protein [Sphingomonas sp. CCH5-D11]|jgi:ParB family chromosome partitioning protein|uniref:ParB/RepB/Spo0J family partition protein n=1 Tax=Sphingomonas sp. CCH5-D11 TaxID=1768786 RepID=UPI0008332D07|nr:ParB/RepB/Spo0J family partition protein [Sphingomonas sp. CCH5-D11]